MIIILKLIFSITEYIYKGTQAFANPTDLASSGVWQNVMLCKTPTFDGVCGILFFIISFAHLCAMIVPTCWHSCQYVSMMADVIANFCLVGCDRCYCHCSSWKPLRCYNGRCFLPTWLIMAIL